MGTDGSATGSRFGASASLLVKVLLVLVVLVLFVAVATFLLSIFYGGYFIRSTINNAVTDLAARSGISTFLLKGVVILLTTPFFFAVGKFTKNVWTLLSGAGNPLSVYMNKYGIIIVCYVAFYWLAMYAVGRDSISQKWCAETPEGLKLFDDHVREPVYGFDTHPCTREEAIAIRRTRNNTAVEEVHEIHPDPATFEFFDALIGNPKVWYSRESNGQVRLFDHPGFDPSSKEQLLPISPQVVEELRGVRRVESAQRRQQSEHAATAERNERLTTEAQAAFDAHNYDVVIDKCSAVLSSSRSPQCAELRHDAGVERAHELVTEATTAVEHGQFDLAIRNGRRAVSLDPQNRRAAQIVQIASDLKGTPAAVN